MTRFNKHYSPYRQGHLSAELVVATLVASFSGKCLIYAVTERNPLHLHHPSGQSHELCCRAAGDSMCRMRMK